MEKYSVSLNKFISDTGYCSRREADNLIKEGRVFINNKPAQTGNRYTEGDVVEVDGSYITVAKKEKNVYLAFNKPRGITTTTDVDIKDNIISYINYPKRIFPIGRLDKDSDGLIFLTNDGDIVNKILRAGNEHEKEYIVRVNKPVTPEFLHKMANGVNILGTKTKSCRINAINRQVFSITLTEGLNRQIRRMCEALDYAVESLKRVRIMNIKLDNIAPGKWRYLSEVEIATIQTLVKSSSKTKEASARPAKEKFEKKDAHYTVRPDNNKSKSFDKAGKKQGASSKSKDNKFGDKPFAGKDKSARRKPAHTPITDKINRKEAERKKEASSKKKGSAKDFYSNRKSKPAHKKRDV